MKKLILLLVITAVLTIPLSASADTQVYTNPFAWAYQVGWDVRIETFNFSNLNPVIDVYSTDGYHDTGNGWWWDQLNSYNESETIWTFAVPIYAFGGLWDLEGPGGPGTEIYVEINGSWIYVGTIPNTLDGTFFGGFWGFVSDVPFTQVRLTPDGSGQETYTLDDMVYAPLIHYLTGGGQIVNDDPEIKKKDQNKVSFSGNLGFTSWFLFPIGQYQFHFHNVSEDTLDGAIFHSTYVDTLVFYRDDEGGPAPPSAYSNVAYFAIDGRLKKKGGEFEDGYRIYAMVADRGEPGVNDSINFALWQGATDLYSSTWDFPCNSAIMNGTTGGTKITAGNLQIHSE